jgi:peptidyl-prolyl cis-trans isomerase D
MLQTFRLLINSLVGKIFFGILLLTFALLGVGYGFRDLVLGMTSGTDPAKVGGQAISLNQLEYRYRRQLEDYQRQLGATFNPSPAQKQEIAQSTLSREIDDTLFDQQATRDGFRVGDTLVRKMIEEEPAFAGTDKKFDPAKFRMLLENQGMSEATFVPQIRASMARQLVLNPVAGSAVAPRFLVDDMYRYRNEQRVAETVTIPNTAATGIPQPTDAQIDTYYKAHAAQFTAPEYRSFTVLDVSPDLFIRDIHPTDDDLHAAYDQHKTEYVQPEKRKITQVVLNDKATADAVLKATQAGKSLADAAKEATKGAIQPIALDALAKAEYPEGLRDPVFGAAKDAVIGPVQTLLGWHVIHIDEIQAGHDVPFDQVKNILIDQVKHDQATDQLSQQIDKLGDKLSGGTQMEAVAQTVGATPVKFGPLDAKGAPPAGKDAPKDPPSAAEVASAFQLQQGETSQFEDDKKGGYYAVRLDGIVAPALRPIADVKAEIVTEWTKEQQAAQIAKRASDLAAKARAGTPLDQIAKEAGVPVETTPGVTRDATGDKVAPALVTALFQLNKPGDVVTVDGDGSQIIARLKSINAADPKTGGDRLAAIQKEMDRSLQADTLAQYRDGLRDSLGVQINPKAVEMVVGQ